MHLVSATADLRIGGHEYLGFPILLWDTMEGCAPVNKFFRHYLLRGAIGSKKSWACTGRALYDYFGFLQAHELSWLDVDRGEHKTLIAAYRDYSFDVVKLKRNTVRSRLHYICEFYSYAHQQGWIGELPFTYETRRSFYRNGGFLAHTTSGNEIQTRDVMPRSHKDLPRYLSVDQKRVLLQAATNPHHQIILRLGLGSGLRKEELATFPLAYVINPDRTTQRSRNVRIHLDPDDGHGMKTKGGKARTIFVTRGLMQDLHYYATHLRGERASLSSQKNGQLFLNQAGEPYANDGKSLDRIVRSIGVKAGIKVWTHLLRHTYATHALVALQRNRASNRIEPLVFLKRQLGHKSIETTMIYLHLINEAADDAVLAYDDELNDFAEAIGG